MLISPAFAQEAAGMADSAGFLMQIMPLLLIFVVFYFLLIRPQQKKMKEHQDMVSTLSKGDEVITNGGLIGKIDKVADDTVTLEIAEKTKIKVRRSAIAEKTSK